MEPFTMNNNRSENATPQKIPKFKKNDMMLPALSFSQSLAYDGPKIIPRVPRYPFERAKIVMKRIGHRSD